MLHQTNPAAYIPAERLSEPGNCAECGCVTQLSEGVMHLGHYHLGNGTMACGLLWLCSHKCFLSWEHKDYMGNS